MDTFQCPASSALGSQFDVKEEKANLILHIYETMIYFYA
jgi:hypothetical protein